MAPLSSKRMMYSVKPWATRAPLFARPLRPAPTPPNFRHTSIAAQKQQFESFEDMISRSEVPVLVDFYATWCGPCQMMSRVLSSVATKLKGRLQIVKIDTDRYPGISSQHKVQALPTIALFVRGKMVFREEGLVTEAQLMDRLNYHISSSSNSG